MAQEQAIPANAKPMQAEPAQRKRVPMGVPVSKLSVPEIPGYVLYWFRGEAGRLQRALDNGYEWVDESEVLVNNRTLGGNTVKSGNTDMGSRVSQVTGDGADADGQPSRLYLMKIKKDLWNEDQLAMIGPGSRLDNIRTGLAGGLLGAENQSVGDKAQIYVDKTRTKLPEFLQRKTS